MSETKKNQIDLERKHFRDNAILQDQKFWKLSEEMEMMMKQKAYLQHQCRKAGALIKSLQENVQELQQTIDKISTGPQDYEIRADDYTEEK